MHDKLLAFFNSPAWANLWTEANRFAHETVVNILRGRQGPEPDASRTDR